MGIREEMNAGFADIRRLLENSEKKHEETITRILDLQRQTDNKLSNHLIESGSRRAEQEGEIKAAKTIAKQTEKAHEEHLKEHTEQAKEKRASTWALWLLAIGAAGSAAFDWIKGLFAHKTS